MLGATMLGLLMAPASGLMFGGAVRSKNTLTALTHALTIFVIVSVTWFMYGFSISFGPSINGIGFVGTPEWSFLVRADIPQCYPSAKAVPLTLFSLYQLAYALFAPSVIAGVWAEKLSHAGLLAFVMIWPLLIYNFVAHWVWHEAGWMNKQNDLSVIDFAGGLVAMTTAGTAALVLAVMLPGRPPALREPHNNPLHYVGAALMLFAWYALVIGAAYRTTNVGTSGTPSSALLGAHMAAMAGALTWAIALRAVDRRWHMRELLHGALAGLAGAAAGVGYCAPYASCVIGVLCASVALLFRRFARDVIWLDDALGVISIFGVPATLGTLLIAFVADTRYGSPLDGIFRDLDQGGKLFKSQIVGVVSVITWTGVMTTILIMVLKRALAFESVAKADDVGIDLVELGERTYDDEAEEREQKIAPQQLAAKMNHYAAAGNVAELKRLLDAGASPSIVDYDYRTPAHFAAFQGHVPVLELLYSHQADLDASDNYGSTPMHAALAHGHVGTARWLEEHGATVVQPLVPRAQVSAQAKPSQASTGPTAVKAAATPTTATTTTTTTTKAAAAESKKGGDAKKSDAKSDVKKSDSKKTDSAATTTTTTTTKADSKKADAGSKKGGASETKKAADAKADGEKKAAKEKEASDDEDGSYEYEYEYVEVSGSEEAAAVAAGAKKK